METGRRLSSRKYLLALLCPFTTLCLVVGYFNYSVDPYFIFGRPLITGFNAVKPSVTTNEMLFKLGAVSLYHPDAVILGMSTARYGYNPASPTWGDLRVMNLGIGGSTAYQWSRFLQHTEQITKLKTAFVALNFVGFNAFYEPQSRQESGFHEDEMLVAPDGKTGNWRAGMIFRSLFTESALRASLMAVHESRLILTEPKLHRVTELTFNPGHEPALSNEERFKNVEQILIDKHLVIKDHKFSFVDPASGISEIEAVRSMIRFANANGIRLVLVLEPGHERLLKIIHSVGLWPTYEQWKREIVNVVAAEKPSMRAPSAVSLFDFGTFSEYAAQPVSPSEMQEVQYWPEALHYKNELGEIILQRSIGAQAGEFHEPGSFGMPVNPDNIETHLAAIRSHFKN